MDTRHQRWQQKLVIFFKYRLRYIQIHRFILKWSLDCQKLSSISTVWVACFDLCIFSLLQSQLKSSLFYSFNVVIRCFSKLLPILLILLLLYSPNSISLSAFTANIVEGNAPEVINTNTAANKHGFTVNGVFYSESSGNINSDEIKEFAGDLKLSDFEIRNFTNNLLSEDLNFIDIDGDYADPLNSFTVTTTKHVWSDANGSVLTDEDKIIGCGSGFPMPLKLKIYISAQTISQYGVPNKSDYVPITKVYQIAPKAVLCYAKPYSIEKNGNYQWIGHIPTSSSKEWDAVLNDKLYATPSPLTGGGYSADYVPNWGFKVEPSESNGKKFPTTGFPGAKFQLIVSGAQSDYIFSLPINSGNQVSIDQQGYVILKGKPTGNVTIRATLKRNPSIQLDYSFNPTNPWVVPYDSMVSYESAVQKCGGVDKLLTRAELSNSPQAFDYEKNRDIVISNAYTRKIGPLFAEWGWTTKSSYPESKWQEYSPPPNFVGRYWTSEKRANGTWLVVHNHDGFVGHYPAKAADIIEGNPLCRE